jgi:hypothetical protein
MNEHLFRIIKHSGMEPDETPVIEHLLGDPQEFNPLGDSESGKDGDLHKIQEHPKYDSGCEFTGHHCDR